MQSNTHFVHNLRRVQGSMPEVIPLSTKLILEQAEELGIQWRSIAGTRILELTYNGKTKHFRYQISSETNDVGFSACLDKGSTNNLLRAAGVSVAEGFKIERYDTEEYWMEVFAALQKPIVVKPSHGLRGEAITLNITDEERYKAAIKRAMEFTTEEDSGVIVEQQFSGKEYRVLTTREKVVGIIHRIPANVVGDGTSTVQALLDKKNSDPRRGKTLDFALFIIEVDTDLLENLAKQNLTLESVPAQGQHVRLRSVSNIMQGGDSIDMTDLVHPSVKEIAVKAVNAIPGLGFAGVDFMTTDITAPQTENTYIIVEINSSPGLCIHEFPYDGQRRFTDREFLYVMFPELKKE